MTKPHMVPIESLLRHDDFIRGLARNLLGRDGRAEDVAQEAWLAAAEQGPRSEATARGWFGRVVRNKVASLRRRDHSAERWRQQLPTTAAVPEPAELIDREAMRSHVVAALLALDPLYRDCLVLRFYEGLKPREIARHLDVPVETVRTRTRRGLERMRAELDQRCGPRRRWLAALLPLAGRSRPPTWPRVAPMAAAALLVVAVCGGVFWLSGDADETQPTRAMVTATGPGPALAAQATEPEAPKEEAGSAEAARPPWRVDGRLRWRNDDAPAEDIPLEVRLISGRKTIAKIGTTRTTADGSFVLSLADLRALSPATYAGASLFISTPGYQNDRWPPGESIPLRKLQAGADSQVVKVDIHVDRPETNKGHLMGVLLGLDGERITNANIAAWRGEAGARELVKGGTVNEVGDFDVPVGSSIYYSRGNGISEPEVLTVIAEVPGVGRAVREGIRAHPTQDQWIGELQLEPLPQLTRIHFELEDGKPLPGVEVLARPGRWSELGKDDHRSIPSVHGDHVATLRTDEDGAIAFRAASRAPWSLWLARPRGVFDEDETQRPDLEFTPGDEDIRVVVPGHVVRVRMIDERGRDASGVQWEAEGWSSGRRASRDRVWSRVTASDVEIPWSSGEDRPDWSLDDDASREGGPSEGALSEVILIGEPGSEWIVCGWTAGFYRGMARVTIPRKTVRSEAELPLRRVEPGAIRIEILEGEEPSDGRFKYFGYMSGVRDVRLRGVLEHGTTFPDLIAGEYSLRMTAGTHHVAERYYSVTVAPGKTTTIKMKVVAAGTIILKVDAPRHLVEENPRYAYLHMDRLDSEPSEAQERIVPIRFLMKLDPEGGGVIAAFPKRNHGEKPPHPFVPGRYRLQIKSEEWESEPMEVELAADTETTVRARLEAVPK